MALNVQENRFNSEYSDSLLSDGVKSESIESPVKAIQGVGQYLENTRSRTIAVAHTCNEIRSCTSAVKANSASTTVKANGLNILSICEVAGGFFGVIAGSIATYTQLNGGVKAFSCKDIEGVVQHSTRGISAFSYMVLSSVLLAKGVMAILVAKGLIASLSATTVSLLALSLIGLAFVLYGFLLMFGVNSFRITRNFSCEFESAKKTGDPLSWLKKELKMGGTSEEQKKAEAQFIRRTSPECLEKVKEAIEKNEIDSKLIEAIEKANFKQKFRSVLTILIGVFGLAAAAASLALGPLAFIPALLFALTFILWLMLDGPILHNFLTDTSWNLVSRNGT